MKNNPSDRSIGFSQFNHHDDQPMTNHHGQLVQLVPGLSILDGRYRLLISHGKNAFLHFWQALDTATNRHVGLTFITAHPAINDDTLDYILRRTQKLSSIHHVGIARVHDVYRLGSTGLVISEWIRGASLIDVAGSCPDPLGATRATQSIAGAAELAHRSGITLGIDHPARIRVSPRGNTVLAFPATLPSCDPDTDIRGIGAILYFLLVNRWPLPLEYPDPSLLAADHDDQGNLINPAVLNPHIPYQIAAAAMHAMQSNGGIRSASTLLNLLQQATTIAERTEIITPVEDHGRSSNDDHNFAPSLEVFRKKSVLVVTSIGAVILVVAVGIVLSMLNSTLGNDKGLNKQRLGLRGPVTSLTRENVPEDAGHLVEISQVSVFSPVGDPDRPQDAHFVIDHDLHTVWSTDAYYDSVPFPSYKPGVGLMLTLSKPTQIRSVTITIAESTGTHVELRSASSSTPGQLDETKIITPATILKPGPNKIPVDVHAEVKNLLVWISTLGVTNGENRSQIAEITVQEE